MPMLCIKADYSNGADELVGISLINGYVGSRSAEHCGVVPMTFDEAVARKVDWNEYADAHGLPNPHPRDGTTRADVF
jgi:hypothetical protein